MQKNLQKEKENAVSMNVTLNFLFEIEMEWMGEGLLLLWLWLAGVGWGYIWYKSRQAEQVGRGERQVFFSSFFSHFLQQHVNKNGTAQNGMSHMHGKARAKGTNTQNAKCGGVQKTRARANGLKM